MEVSWHKVRAAYVTKSTHPAPVIPAEPDGAISLSHQVSELIAGSSPSEAMPPAPATMSWVAFAVGRARDLTSLATTANPHPPPRPAPLREFLGGAERGSARCSGIRDDGSGGGERTV